LSRNTSSRVALFLPRIALIVISANLPEAWSVFGEKLDPIDPFRALPEIPIGNDSPHWSSMLARKWLSFPGMREKDVFVGKRLERYVCRVAIIGVQHHVARFRHWPHQVDQCAACHAAPVIVVPAPSGYTMDIACRLDLRQSQKLRERKGHGLLNNTANPQTPIFGFHVRLNPEIEHRPVRHQLLS